MISGENYAKHLRCCVFRKCVSFAIDPRHRKIRCGGSDRQDIGNLPAKQGKQQADPEPDDEIQFDHSPNTRLFQDFLQKNVINNLQLVVPSGIEPLPTASEAIVLSIGPRDQGAVAGRRIRPHPAWQGEG